MRLGDVIAGFRPDDPGMVGPAFNEVLESQRIRAAQSRNALPLVAGAGLIYVVALWGEVNAFNMLAWMGLNIALAVVRTGVCNRMVGSFDKATTTARLYRNEQWLFATALSSTTALGSGFWWLCLDGTDKVVLAVTLLSCIYGVGTTVNSAIHARGMPVLLVSNLGQGVVFFGIVRSPVDFEVAVALAAMILLLSQFTRQISHLFSDSILIRHENVEKNLRLEEQKALVEESLAAARAANEDKNRFMAAASHDLRQPLHAMTLFLGSLKRRVAGGPDAELVDKIEENSNVLHDQFNSLLDLSKFDAGVVEPQYSVFRLDALLQKIVDGATPNAEDKGIGLKLQAKPVAIRSDVLLLERLLRNLLVNAIQFTDEGAVEISVAEGDRGTVVEVRDSGQGIAAEDLDEIFKDYYQVHNKARTKSKGTGLGLAIVKRIGALLELELDVQSVLGTGSTFSVTIPTAQVVEGFVDIPTTAARDEALDELEIPDLRFLLVDDDDAILEALSGLISGWGGSCSTASGFEQVREWVSAGQHFDMAILDDMLNEEASGLDIAHFLQEFLDAERILITTGHSSVQRLEQLRQSGFEVMVKPVGHRQLRAAIQDALQPKA